MKDNLTPIAPEKISVVIQGPLYRALAPRRGILSTIASIREHLPGAEIIVSTWDREDTSDLEGCIVIRSEEPSDFIDSAGNRINTNRQILSTLAGISASNREYILKFRSDHCLTGKTLASVGFYEERITSSGRFFCTPITLTNLFIRNPARVPMLFHLSDLVQFGRREDMMDLWNQPLLSETQILNPDGPRRNPFGNFIGFSNLRETPEQSLALGWLKRHGVPVQINHVCEVNSKLLLLWEQTLADNFRILDWRQADVSFPERFFKVGYALRSVYSPAEIRQARHLTETPWYAARQAYVWLNQYVFGCFRFNWLVCTASIVLFSFSPSLATKIRSVWRKAKGTIHSPSGRI